MEFKTRRRNVSEGDSFLKDVFVGVREFGEIGRGGDLYKWDRLFRR